MPNNRKTEGKIKTPKRRKGKTQDLLRQRNLAKLLSEDGGKTPIGKLMVKAGYSKAYSKNPNHLKETLSWKELMEKYYPDDKVAEAEGQQLHASQIDHYIFPGGNTNEEIKEIIESYPNCKLIKIKKELQWKWAYFSSPDNNAIGKSLDRIYKIKNKYPKEAPPSFNAFQITDDQLTRIFERPKNK